MAGVKNIAWICLLGMLLITACSTPRKQAVDAFETIRDDEMGRSIKASRALGHTYRVNKQSDGNSEYFFENEKTGCAFSYIVSSAQVVLSWKYVSARNLCYVSSGWWQPW